MFESHMEIWIKDNDKMMLLMNYKKISIHGEENCYLINKKDLSNILKIKQFVLFDIVFLIRSNYSRFDLWIKIWLHASFSAQGLQLWKVAKIFIELQEIILETLSNFEFIVRKKKKNFSMKYQNFWLTLQIMKES